MPPSLRGCVAARSTRHTRGESCRPSSSRSCWLTWAPTRTRSGRSATRRSSGTATPCGLVL
eukprot:151557-Pyramimonas_sp.AAC.1